MGRWEAGVVPRMRGRIELLLVLTKSDASSIMQAAANHVIHSRLSLWGAEQFRSSARTFRSPTHVAQGMTIVDTKRSESSSAEGRTGSVDFVVSEVVRALYEGRLVAGQKLTESALTQRLGVGRGSVREALRRLEAEGLVSMSLHRGASIRHFTRDGVRDLLEVTEVMAGFSARMAAERLQRTEDAASLRETVNNLAAALESGDSYGIGRNRWQFFEELVALTSNHELPRTLPRFDHIILRNQFRAAFDLNNERKDLAQFRQVLELILVREGPGAERAMRQHIRDASLAIQRLPDHHFAV